MSQFRAKRLAQQLPLVLLLLVAGRTLPGQTWTADNGNGTFSNPLFYDEFSDPA